MSEAPCIFCAIAAGSAPARVLAETADTLTILDIAPATPGHTLVIPKEHYPTLFETPSDVAAQLMVQGQAAMQQLETALAPDGFTFALMVKAAGWQTVYHVHLHVIPRYSNDSLKPPWVETLAPNAELEAMFQRIRT